MHFQSRLFLSLCVCSTKKEMSSSSVFMAFQRINGGAREKDQRGTQTFFFFSEKLFLLFGGPKKDYKKWWTLIVIYLVNMASFIRHTKFEKNMLLIYLPWWSELGMDVELYPIPRHMGMVISSHRASFFTAKTGPPLFTALLDTDGTLTGPAANPSTDQTVQKSVSVAASHTHMKPIAMASSEFTVLWRKRSPHLLTKHWRKPCPSAFNKTLEDETNSIWRSRRRRCLCLDPTTDEQRLAHDLLSQTRPETSRGGRTVEPSGGFGHRAGAVSPRLESQCVWEEMCFPILQDGYQR